MKREKLNKQLLFACVFISGSSPFCKDTITVFTIYPNKGWKFWIQQYLMSFFLYCSFSDYIQISLMSSCWQFLFDFQSRSVSTITTTTTTLTFPCFSYKHRPKDESWAKRIEGLLDINIYINLWYIVLRQNISYIRSVQVHYEHLLGHQISFYGHRGLGWVLLQSFRLLYKYLFKLFGKFVYINFLRFSTFDIMW